MNNCSNFMYNFINFYLSYGGGIYLGFYFLVIMNGGLGFFYGISSWFWIKLEGNEFYIG